MTLAYIGLGANLGDAAGQVRSAFGELDRMPHSRVVRKSSLYRSAPIGNPDQPAFVNAAAQVETGLPAQRLLAEMQQIEQRHGRQRSFANAPRTLDLDLLLYGNLTLDTPDLRVPHPRLHERAFVLHPLLEIAPDVVIPGLGPASAHLAACAGQNVERMGG